MSTAESGYVIPESVRVTRHAIERFGERIQSGLSLGRVSRIIRYDVSMAVRTGRASKRAPRWCFVNARPRGDKQWQKGKLYVWNEDETVCYNVARQEGGTRLVVITVYKRRRVGD